MTIYTNIGEIGSKMPKISNKVYIPAGETTKSELIKEELITSNTTGNLINAGYTAYQVPTNYVLYIQEVSLSSYNNANTACTILMKKGTNPATPLENAFLQHSVANPFGGSGIGQVSNSVMAFNQPFKIESGQIIQVYSFGNSINYFTIKGYLVKSSI